MTQRNLSSGFHPLAIVTKLVFFLIPFIGHSQTNLRLHFLNTQLEERHLCLKIPFEVNEIEFDRLVDGSVKIYSGSDLIINHCGESITAVQKYENLKINQKVCLQLITNEDFWLQLKQDGTDKEIIIRK